MGSAVGWADSFRALDMSTERQDKTAQDFWRHKPLRLVKMINGIELARPLGEKVRQKNRIYESGDNPYLYASKLRPTWTSHLWCIRIVILSRSRGSPQDPRSLQTGSVGSRRRSVGYRSTRVR